MDKQERLREAFGKLNKEQREAAESLDGPVLVVAGPGTGKTQLLSLRVVNILEQRDVAPENILCLTFTDAGAEAMTKRLASFIGRDAYAVRIATFHSFAAGLRARYPEYFERSSFDTQVTNLQAKKLINKLLADLAVADPLYQRAQGTVFSHHTDVASFFGSLDRSGMSPCTLRAIAEQNRATFAYLEEETELLAALSTETPSRREDKRAYVAALLAEVNGALNSLPPALREPVVEIPGSYVPYGVYLAERFNTAELFEDTGTVGKTTGLRKLKVELFEGAPSKGAPLSFKDKKLNEKMLSAVGLYERYQDVLRTKGLYDFQDMIHDAAWALESHAAFQALLQEQYRYILIDEFQDTNGSQMRLVDLLTEGIWSPNILAVGDDDQSIMRFQGASVEFINQFERHYACGVKRIVLKTNYRSTPTLVALGQVVAAQIENRSPASEHEKHLEAFRAEEGPAHVTAELYPSPEAEYYGVAREIVKLIKGGFIREAQKPEEALAVIASRHKNLRALIPYLQLFDIPFTYRITNAISEIASLETMVALLNFAMQYEAGSKERASVWLAQILASKEFAHAYGLCEQDITQFALAQRREADWFQALGASEHVPFQRLHAWLAGCCAKAPSLSARAMLYELSLPLRNYYNKTSDNDLYELIEFNYGFKALLEFVSEELCESDESKEVLGTSLKLADLSSVLSDAQNFNVDIEAQVPVGKEGAIVLTTAHSSKGEEYDLVYLLDGDDASWHGSGKAGTLTTKNLLINTTKDEDDHRRLLFVALTRAKSHLRIAQAKPAVLRELVDEISLEEGAFTLLEQVTIAEESWQDRYLPKAVTLKGWAVEALARRKLSASLLNSFVAYPGEDLSGEPFLKEQILQLPKEPSINAAYGTVVHVFFEEYYAKVVRTGRLTAAELIQRTHAALEVLDFEPEHIRHCHQYFDQVVQAFVPMLDTMLAGEVQVERSFTAEVDGVPLTGKVDLLLLNKAERSLEVYDYKTTAYREGKLDANHVRQLHFYRLLLENTPEFTGWKVLGGADLYVQPQRELGFELPPVRFLRVSDEELSQVRALAHAVWYRLQNGLFDTAAFLGSERYATLCQASVYKTNSGNNKKGDQKAPSKEDLQRAYEEWLIEEQGARAHD